MLIFVDLTQFKPIIMKNILKAFALVAVLFMASCTDNEIVPTAKEQKLNEKELFGTRKDLSSNPNNNGGEDPDDSEVN